MFVYIIFYYNHIYITFKRNLLETICKTWYLYIYIYKFFSFGQSSNSNVFLAPCNRPQPHFPLPCWGNLPNWMYTWHHVIVHLTMTDHFLYVISDFDLRAFATMAFHRHHPRHWADTICHTIHVVELVPFATCSKKVRGLTGHPRLQASELLMESNHPEPPHYLCTTHRSRGETLGYINP